MKQLLQNMRDGKTEIVEVPIPSNQPGMILIKTAVSLVSAGTERMVVEFAEKNLVAKAAARPDLVRQVINKARLEGIFPTFQATFNRLDQPMTLGYSSSGTVISTGDGVTGFLPGDRVACAGGGFAVHAEYALVPMNLLVHLPPEVDFESGAFATLGAVSMHGFRLASPQVGSSIAIIGLGLLGLLAAEISRAAGCRVFGIDVDQRRVNLARQLGVVASARSDVENQALTFTNQRGFDAALICADTPSNDPVELAGTLTREKGQVVAIGAVGLQIPRKLYYEKELNFQVSRSYGPGRYDPDYEIKGHDYPYGFVRWTENRNMEAFIDLAARKCIDIHPLITHRFSIENAPQGYDLITGKSREPYLGVIVTYPHEADLKSSAPIPVQVAAPLPKSALSLGVLGAGNYARAVFLPVVSKGKEIAKHSIASATGTSAAHAARKYGFQYALSEEQQVLNDPDINIVAILTRHGQHARQVCTALQNGKSVYCEKPLAVNPAQLKEVNEILTQPEIPLLTVGFNRRFSPLSLELKNFLQSRTEPLNVIYRVNAGFLPSSHWLHDPEQGGGRLIGEGCHFIDYMTFLTGELPVTVEARSLPDHGKYHQDNVCIIIAYPDGSLGTLFYLANGDKNFSKERIEVFTGGKIAVLDDFRSLEMVFQGRRRMTRSRFKQDKGHAASWNAFLDAVKSGGPPLIPYDQIISTTQATFAAVESIQTGVPVNLAARM